MPFSATKTDSEILQTKEAVQSAKGYSSPTCAHCLPGRLACREGQELKHTLQEDISVVNSIPSWDGIRGGSFTFLFYFVFFPKSIELNFLLYLVSLIQFITQAVY